MNNVGCQNIRGLGKGPKLPHISKLVEEHKFLVLELLETKHSRLERYKVRRIWGNDVFSWADVPATDSGSKGIVIIWDSEGFNCYNVYKKNRWAIIEGKMNIINQECIIGFVNGGNDRLKRKGIHDELTHWGVNN